MARAGVTKALVEQSAVALADAGGLEAVTISAIARRLGVQPASMYAHIAGVGALQDMVHRRALAELAQRLEEAIAGRAAGDALRAFAEAHRLLLAEHPGLWNALQRPAGPEVATSPEAARTANLQLAVLRGYGLDGDAAVHAARFLGATLNGFVSLQSVGAFAHRDAEIEASWALTLDALDGALERWPRDGSPLQAPYSPQG